MRLIDADPSLASRPDFGSGVSDRAHSLRARRLSDLSLGEVAFCLRQGIAVAHVAPLALSAVAVQPLLEAEFYPGDLLVSLVQAATRYGLGSAETAELSEVCSAALAGAEAIQDSVVPAALAFLDSRYAGPIRPSCTQP